MTDNRQLLGIIVFLSFFGFVLDGLGLITFQLFNPITLTVLAVGLIASVGAGNTPIAKGVAVGVVYVALIGSIFFSDGFFNAVPPLVFGVILVPLSLAVGFIMLNLARG